ncbi:MAG: hypothetical protein A4E32_00641 [Methanomassiliicoccales archaeon PtaU1.Bin124]|nr:MAG: hypothetical protein A4E32_00641 [Methanomassiliicoccales archaeon PtaU1.Bin124]
MIMPKCEECPILALHQQVIESIREVTNAEIPVKFNMVSKNNNKCSLTNARPGRID